MNPGASMLEVWRYASMCQANVDRDDWRAAHLRRSRQANLYHERSFVPHWLAVGVSLNAVTEISAGVTTKSAAPSWPVMIALLVCGVSRSLALYFCVGKKEREWSDSQARFASSTAASQGSPQCGRQSTGTGRQISSYDLKQAAADGFGV